MKRKFINRIEFQISTDWVDPLDDPEDEFVPGDWESVSGKLYEEDGDEYIYIKREYLNDVLEANIANVTHTVDLNVDLESEIDLDDVDSMNLNF